jgi:putative phosphoribosyl transferase
MFRNREDAGRKLAQALMRFKDERPSVLALPRGGVPVAYEVAKALNAPLDLVLVRKIGAPFQPELAVAAVIDGSRPELVVNERLAWELGIDDAYIAREEMRQLREIERQRQLYLAGLERVPIQDKTAIIIDDGIATGATIRAAIHATRRAKPKRIVVAAPVAPAETVAALRSEADDVLCLEEPEYFAGVGLHYIDFTQVDDERVRTLLARAAAGFRAKTA